MSKRKVIPHFHIVPHYRIIAKLDSGSWFVIASVYYKSDAMRFKELIGRAAVMQALIGDEWVDV